MLYKMLTLEEAGWKVHRNSSCYLLPLFCKSELCQTINKRKKIAGSLGLSGKKANSILLSHFATSLSCIGEGNGNPLQCSCLENPRDGEAWWAAVYGVAQSRTWLTRLSSSSSGMAQCRNPWGFGVAGKYCVAGGWDCRGGWCKQSRGPNLSIMMFPGLF